MIKSKPLPEHVFQSISALHQAINLLRQTSNALRDVLIHHNIRICMDGRGMIKDIMIAQRKTVLAYCKIGHFLLIANLGREK